MNIAIIGAGFAGLATAYFLQEFEGIDVTIFEESQVGAGASGAASGLLHPYPGIMARRSQFAEKALEISKELLRVAQAHTHLIVSTHGGILRRSLSDEQQMRLQNHIEVYGDVEEIESRLFLIHSGVTVDSMNYLTGLAKAIEKKGGKILIQKIKALSALANFDHIVLATGYGMANFPECAHLKVKFLKGQALRLAGSSPFEKSLIEKGYIAHLEKAPFFEIGSTYERVFETAEPSLNIAKKLLADKLSEIRDAEILRCKAGVRVCSQSHYLPIVEKIGKKVTVFTGLGSRGLLYHGYFGRKIANEIAQKGKIA